MLPKDMNVPECPHHRCMPRHAGYAYVAQFAAICRMLCTSHLMHGKLSSIQLTSNRSTTVALLELPDCEKEPMMSS